MFDQRSTHPLLVQLEEWVRKDMPKINNAIERQEIQPQALIDAFRPWSKKILQELEPATLSRDQARHAIQLIGFGIGSAERHFQSLHIPAGAALAQCTGIEDITSHLAMIAAHPPRDTHYTYWLWNNRSPLTFTDDPQEVFFNRAVNHTHELHTASSDLIRQICESEVSILSTDARKIIQTAAENNMTLHEHFRSFMTKEPESGHRAVEPRFFMTRMRTYLPSYPIKGTDWNGVNAANLSAQMQIDYLIGTTMDDYEKTVRARFKYMTDEDRTNLEYDMALPSLFDIFLHQMSITRNELSVLNVETLAGLIAVQSTTFRQNLASYMDLVYACGRLTSIHWALIQNYLVKASANLSSEDRARLPVSPDRGTGGKTHEETETIMRMRKHHPLITKLMDALTGNNHLPLAV